MAFAITVHFDNTPGFGDPHLWVWYDGTAQHEDLAPSAADGFGIAFTVAASRPAFGFTFKDGPGTGGPWEGVDRRYSPVGAARPDGAEVWARGGQPFAYAVEPARPETLTAAAFLAELTAWPGLRPGNYLSASGCPSGLGATVLADGRVLFGLYHPTAAQVYLVGDFNDWQSPGHGQPDPGQFIPLRLYRGLGGLPNTWLTVTDRAHAGDSYRFFVVGGVPRDDQGREFRNSIDPYSRRLNADFTRNDSVVVDAAGFAWTDDGWRTPDPAGLVLYELSVAGFTQGDPDIDPASQARFAGITERLADGYFERLGVSALSLMPLAEVPSQQGPTSLGYDPSLFMAVERDFGAPDDLRQLIDTAHAHGLAVLVDMVFNHTSDTFNPLWQQVLTSPDDSSGGLYFSGSTPWGNRIASERPDVQAMLIDACRLFLTEYHVDGFRFDATYHDFMSHQFLLRLATELHDAKPGVLLVAENLPNEPDLNRSGYDGYAQWCNQFHDKIKALLREGQFEGEQPTPDHLADAMYFSHASFASHTSNVVNYCQSHDENSVAHEVRTMPNLDNAFAADRKGRLGVLATLVALGQPMLFMGQEFNLDQPRNVVTVDWPADLDQHAFFRWTCGMVHLRRRYPGLRLSGYDPAGTGQFTWILGPWMDDQHGAGRPVVGWRAQPSESADQTLVVLLNFSPQDMTAELELGLPGRWVKLADIGTVEDVPPAGTNSAGASTALVSADGRYSPFVLLSLRRTGPSGTDSLLVYQGAALGLSAMTHGEPDVAVEHLENAWQLATRFGLGHPGVVPFLADLVEAHIRCGDARRAEQLLEWLEDRGDAMGLVYAAAAAHRCRGLLAHSVEESLSEFTAARTAHARCTMPFELARTQLCQGEVLRRARRLMDARKVLREAHRIFESLSARPWADRVARELVASGARSHGRVEGAFAGLDSLTPQELQIARAVASGKNNGEVSAALFVSRKTVEAHLTRIYRKLGIHSRVDLTRALLTGGIAD